MQFETENDIEFRPPAQRPVPLREAVTFPLDRVAFLRAVEEVIPQIVHPASGSAWEYDGYRRTTLFLVQSQDLEHGLGAYTVEFELQFAGQQTTIAVCDSSQPVQQLFRELIGKLALHLLQRMSGRN